MTQIELLNTLVNPPILVVAKLTKNPKSFSRNYYLDPEDRQQFDVGTLTPKEKGHIYQYIQFDSNTVKVHMPYRVMDQELSSLITELKLRSFKSTGETRRVHKDRLTSIKKHNSCIQDFLLSKSDFEVFKSRGTNSSYSFIDHSVNLSHVNEACHSLGIHAETICSKVGECREASQEGLISLEQLMDNLKQVEAEIASFKIANKEIVKMLDQLDSEYGRKTDALSARHMYGLVRDSINLVTNLDLSRCYSECVYYLSSSETNEQRPGYLGTLSQELSRLATHFPSLTHVCAEGDDVVLKLSGVKIRLSGNTIKIEGDIASLRPYTSGVDLQDQKEGSRFSGILFQE